ncbi:hypothetical protein N7466_006712 [Penicillium verhagenii]|uniref:uncharacterized protein n=1 Tax=Penicillium verhagenii TaxID=1562060 RepID=UPI00254581AB|nr:uncharacterized protein N7466_006712 [Penicillium verhagenii]KAJ5927756.1 hypothetical protein N7466_006712 [Penicillium verhagenii]
MPGQVQGDEDRFRRVDHEGCPWIFNTGPFHKSTDARCAVDAPKDNLSCRGVRRAPPPFSPEYPSSTYVGHPVVTCMLSSIGELTPGS